MRVHQSRCSPNQERLGVHDKNNRGKTIEYLSEASKIPLEHMFNSYYDCSAEWCFTIRASEEGKTYNETDDKFHCEQNDNHMYNLLRKTLLLFKTEKVLK